jgi:hypothetical protein
MMSCMTSTAWSCLVLSFCCTEPVSSHGVVLSGRITTVAMSKSDQLGLCCTVEPNYSGMCPFFIPVVNSPLGAVGYVAATKLSSRGGEAGAMWQRRSPPRQGGKV